MLKNKNIRQCLELVNALWLRAGLIYLLDHATFLTSIGVGRLFNSPSGTSLLWFFDKSIALSLKTLLIAWTLSRIIEILSRESPAPDVYAFGKFLRRGLWVVILATSLPFIIHFLIWISTRTNIIQLPLIVAVLSPFIALWIAHEFIRIKFGKLLPSIKINDIPFNWPTIIGLTFFLGASLSIFFINQNTPHLTWITPLTEIISTQIFFFSFAFLTQQILAANPKIQEHFTSPKTLIMVNPAGGIALLCVFSILQRLEAAFAIVLKSLTPPEYRTIAYNDLIWQNHFYQENALVAITSFTFTSSEAYHIAREFKKRGCKVIMGGPHVSFFPDEALEFCDSVVIGRAESVWETVIHDYENNSLKRIYNGDYCPKAQEKTYQYLLKAAPTTTAGFIHASRGCKFNCNFCTIPAISGRYLLERDVDQLIALIKHATQENKYFVFLDNNLYIEPAFTKKLLRALIPLKLRWTADMSIDVAKDEETMALLKESGCNTLLIGFEIIPFSKEARRGKYTYANEYLVLARKIHKLGIKIRGQFIFAFPDDTWESLWQLWLFCLKISLFNASISFLTPIPGSKYLEDCIKKENIINLNWCRYGMLQQTTQHPRFKQPVFFQKGFALLALIFFLTTSTAGRIVFVIIVSLGLLIFFNTDNSPHQTPHEQTQHALMR